MIPPRFAHPVFCLITSGLMSCIVTCVATIKAIGLGPQTFGDWMAAWSLSWPIAFVIILIAGPRIRRWVDSKTRR
ncbi:DUF2798 domain-containing protein [Ruegeria sp. 2012CJ41-6]|uniref:DUF2798 domain-containing protein n=1 Tax=Ruegeria spongiae TaxID=2942209 RepID=A0ABT0Q1C8_9RHOB|nr:DUF2798 domain-containing protein [Ruegeria spongiae]MCL6282739.1 DUF2798 domain-containing protein [Ruegeria spongiae]